ncbi:MAG: DUF4212 domain-containing protein [bacterium]|nr:DUF4212 domain-containing protein [bacterium]
MNNLATPPDSNHAKPYWHASMRIMALILCIWAVISFGCGIILRDWLDAHLSVGNAPFGFWMAQQGSIAGFVILLVFYALLMNRLDKKHGFDEKDEKTTDHTQDTSMKAFEE